MTRSRIATALHRESGVPESLLERRIQRALDEDEIVEKSLASHIFGTPGDQPMTDQSRHNLRLTSAPFVDGLRGVWDALLASDDSGIDPDLLSAYADGRLSDQQRQELRARIARRWPTDFCCGG